MRIGAYTVTKSGDVIFFYAHPAQDVEPVDPAQAKAILKEIIETEPQLYRALDGTGDEYRQLLGFANYAIYCQLPSFKAVPNEKRIDVNVGPLSDKEVILDGLRVVASNLLADMTEEESDAARAGYTSDVEDDNAGFTRTEEEAQGF